MISNIQSESLVLSTVGLVAMPLLALRVRRAFKPVELTRYNAITTWTGVVLFLAALILCALPAVLTLAGQGVADRHFFPGDTAVGWLSAAIALAVIGEMLLGFRLVRRVERRLRIESAVGLHHRLRDFDLVVLESQHPIAYAVGGRNPQVVVTSGLLSALTLAEGVSVLQHEAAHIVLGHRRHLRLIGLLEPIGRWLYPARRLVEVSRLALEQAADASTSNAAATRRALLKLSNVYAAPGVAAFTAGDVLHRLTALGAEQEDPQTSVRTMMYSSAVSLATLSLAALAVFWL